MQLNRKHLMKRSFGRRKNVPNKPLMLLRLLFLIFLCALNTNKKHTQSQWPHSIEQVRFVVRLFVHFYFYLNFPSSFKLVHLIWFSSAFLSFRSLAQWPLFPFQLIWFFWFALWHRSKRTNERTQSKSEHIFSTIFYLTYDNIIVSFLCGHQWDVEEF